MLRSLSIHNIALIASLDIELGDGLNILSGETGAGKSIIIDSLNFVLGERADKSLIRFGADEASVEAVFEDYSTDTIAAYMDDLGIECEDVLILRRKMSATKNECRINGKQVTLSTLKGLTELLVDIHGQHEHQSLLRVQTHLSLLDSVGGEGLDDAKAKVKTLYSGYKALQKQLERFGDEDERARRVDVLSYQVDEIEKADIKPDEETSLIDKRRAIRNSEKILSSLRSARDTLDGYDAGSVTASLKTAGSSLNAISDYGEDIAVLYDRIETARTEVKDISETLSDMLGSYDFDAHTAEQIEERLDLVRTLKRKYGETEDKVLLFLENARIVLDTLKNAAGTVAELQSEIASQAKQLVSALGALTTLRKKTAKVFEEKMLSDLKDLGMGGSTFKVDFKAYPSDDVLLHAGSDGADEVEFLISPNVGEPLKPLAKIISGGEMSRFMLALKDILAGKDDIGTMVFDEIDTGISGNIMTAVAVKMCNISRTRQVIAVTHMPELAAMADNHYLIQKQVEGEHTLTHVNLLDENGDMNELARLIGGANYSGFALPHAKEMKKWSNGYKSSLK